MLQFYNTLSRKKENFEPLLQGEVKMYTCGPTVYDYFHIGNARSFISSDLIYRYLLFRGYKVTYLMNITDIDDKIIKKSNEEGVASSEIAERYTKAFLDDLTALKVQKATLYPKATEHIPQIIALVEKLIANGAAYASGGDVYYSIDAFPGYGKLSGKNIDDLEAGARVEVNTVKKNPMDFALWKAAKPGEPWWESPWGQGRPGWHIECSAMSCNHLGDTFDIHAGGSDLIFPHHENEIAQSEGATGKQFVRYWLHFGFLNIDNEKMSKSLGNFFTVRDILKKFSAETLRFFYAQTHYASPLNFTETGLRSAESGVERFKNFALILKEALANATENGAVPEFSTGHYYDEFCKVMDDDINAPQGLAVLSDFMREANKFLASGPLQKAFTEQLAQFFFATAGGIFGLIPAEESASAGMEEQLLNLIIEVRKQAKLQKQYAIADLIRDELKKIGLELRDSKEKTTIVRI